MRVEVQKHGTVTVLTPQDALIESNVHDLHAALEREAEQRNVRVVLDLSNVPYVDSAGIELLLAHCGNPPLQPSARKLPPSEGAPRSEPIRAREAAPGGLRPRLAGLSDTVREALDLTDTLKRFAIFDSVHAAVRSYV